MQCVEALVERLTTAGWLTREAVKVALYEVPGTTSHRR